MRRLLAALLASVMLVGAADARTLIVVPKRPFDSGGGGETTSLMQLDRNLDALNDLLKSMGADGNYLLMPQAAITTEMARTGLVYFKRTSTWGWDANGPSEQFDGVICPSYPGSSAQTYFATCRWDSMTRVARGGPLVPHLYLLDNVTALRTSEDNIFKASAATRCSVGVAEDAQKVTTSGAQSFYMVEKPSVRWIPHTYTNAFPISGMTVPGGIRKLLALSTNGLSQYAYPKQCQWPDSLPFYSATSETVVVWDRQWAGLASCPTAKTMTFCTWFGNGVLSDTLFNNTIVGFTDGKAEGELSVLRFGLAHFDSLIGGRLFTKEPAVRGIVVEAAVSRGLRRWTGGIAPGDTSAFYSSLDSLAAWNVPVTFAANVSSDSATTYARDIIKLRQVTSARFTPYSTCGVFDTSATSIGAGLGKTSNTRWVDPWGRWRRRVFVGDFNTWSDTSIATMAKRQIAACDSIFGRPTVRVMVPPNDEWSPGIWGETQPYIAKKHSRLYADSMMYALSRGGFIGVLANGQSDECNLSVSSGAGYTNPRGYIGRQGWYRPKFNGTATSSSGVVSYAGATMDPFMVLRHWGGTMGLGKEQVSQWGDSTSAATQGAWSYLGATLDRANGSFWCDKWYNSDIWYDTGTYITANFWTTYQNVVWPTIDVLTKPERSHVLRLFCSDLSGNPTNPARTGLHVIRSLQQSFTATNLAAGRTLVRLGYLDEVRP